MSKNNTTPPQPAVLALADGSVFHGRSIGVAGHTVGEVVFNTAMTGYQEILTDPSYARQIVTLTYPHIGNVGTNALDNESADVHAAGLVIRDLSVTESNWRSEASLSEFLQTHGLVAIADIDTRQLTRMLREHGAQNGCILAGDTIDIVDAIALAQNFPGLLGMDLASVVTTTSSYAWTEGWWRLQDNRYTKLDREPSYHVVAYDFGVKHAILRMLVERGCRVTVVPATTSASEVLALRPDGVFLSNGPGDPEPCNYAIAAIRELLDQNIPLFGICLGHQLLSLAAGANTVKMKFGHHGANHPVLAAASGQVMITSQNHGFAVDEASLPADLQVTHRSLFDQSLQGVRHTQKPAFGFQGHPEASPGPQDISPLFDEFVQMIEQHRMALRSQ